ncbi:MAG: hypothetical protein H5T64_09195 [Chloroflexi bacterium]|nr:hypothetical protein [Chloroflexota bacterium]
MTDDWACIFAVEVLMSLALILWSLRIWLKPSSLSPDSFMYRYFYVRWRAWRGASGVESEKLTERQIRYFGIGGVIVGIVGIAVVIMGLALGRP